uniref:Tetraspanin 9 n=1 Tax=Podarcis muralis TaxID=64176 RepID=A0A670JUS2_PODMU
MIGRESVAFPHIYIPNQIIPKGCTIYVMTVTLLVFQDLKEGLKLYNTENNVGLKNAWNIIQAEMHCCGVTDYKDWYLVLGENTVPDRCCIENSEDCGRNSTNTNLVWKTVLGTEIFQFKRLFYNHCLVTTVT